MNTRTPFSPDTLADIGRALYGERWQTPLSQDLNVNDRSLRRWLNGEVPIPEAVEFEARVLLERRHDEMGGIIRYTVSPTQRTIFHHPTGSYFKYDDSDNVSFVFGPNVPDDQKPLLTFGAAEALRHDHERQKRIQPRYVDPKSGRSSAPGEITVDYKGFAIIRPTIRIDAARYIVNIASENPSLLAKLGGRAVVIEDVTLDGVIAKAMRHIDGLM